MPCGRRTMSSTRPFTFCASCCTSRGISQARRTCLYRLCLAASLVEDLPGDEMASKHTKEGKAAEKLRTMRAKLHNALGMAVHLQGEELPARRARVLIVLGNPVEAAFRMDNKHMTSEVECLQRSCAYAHFGHTYVLPRLWSKLSSIQSLQQLGSRHGRRVLC